jgi:hypothetical protein
MDQNNPREDASGAQLPADPGGGETSAWNQVPGQEQSQRAAPGNPEAAGDYAAWSPDTSYQQQPQPPAAPPLSDTQAYAAPQPQSATYSEQPADAQQYAQQQYAQQQYAQQQYAQQQYAQQQYAQQQPQQPPQQQPQPGYYDPAAYGQQAYQQPQYYDPAAYGQQYPQPGYQQPQQPQYYDPAAYGQQPGYYDPAAYGQQYPQPGYPPQAGQPYPYAQPGQEPWPGQEQAWVQGGAGYGRSFMAVLAAWVLLTWGIVWAVLGALVLWVQSVTSLIGDAQLSTEAMDLARRADEQIVAVGGIALILGLIHVIGAIGIFGHRRWGRAFGIVLGLLGVLIGLGIITVAAGIEALDVGVDEAIKGEEASLGGSLLVLATYLLVFLAMFVGRRHFRKQGVEG